MPGGLAVKETSFQLRQAVVPGQVNQTGPVSAARRVLLASPGIAHLRKLCASSVFPHRSAPRQALIDPVPARTKWANTESAYVLAGHVTINDPPFRHAPRTARSFAISTGRANCGKYAGFKRAAHAREVCPKQFPVLLVNPLLFRRKDRSGKGAMRYRLRAVFRGPAILPDGNLPRLNS